MYNFTEKKCSPSELKFPCRNGGYQDPNDCTRCRCPSGTAGAECARIADPAGVDMQTCGGELYFDHCTMRTLTLPTWPMPYGEDFDCTWRIHTPANGVALAFQSAPDMPCNPADTCYDFVEVRTDMERLDAPGKL